MSRRMRRSAEIISGRAKSVSARVGGASGLVERTGIRANIIRYNQRLGGDRAKRPVHFRSANQLDSFQSPARGAAERVRSPTRIGTRRFSGLDAKIFTRMAVYRDKCE